ncbi:MAG: hypothetical protein IKW95_02660 [Lachnospiraceae bacterium]|nr:hypothetical protein [Lachnospiraceae bacterium]
MQVITTERLVIRPIEPGDCEAVHRYAGDPSIDMMLFLPKTEEERLDCLEKMLQHVEKGRCADPSVPHNLAWYYLPYLDQERYDPVRKSKRFKAVKEKLASIAK